MNEDLAISLHEVSKCYKRYERPIDRLRELLFPGKTKVQEFWALQNTNLIVPKGQTVGLIGQNGSGKSTILQLIAGVLSPSSGKVVVNGKIAALLELGSGFNFDYTGRQNVLFSGRLLGLTQKEIEARLPTIEAFAEIGDFIDQPVKTYSSGMIVRLAFAVATQVDADILIIDEALSVGDMYFQAKCIEKMKSLKKSKTFFFVSHSISTVRNFCDRAIWIENGGIVDDGECSVVCEKYQDKMAYLQEALIKPTSASLYRKDSLGNSYIEIQQVKTNKSSYYSGDDIIVEMSLNFKSQKYKSWGAGIIIYNGSGEIVTLFSTIRDDLSVNSNFNTISLTIENNKFTRGTYFISASVTDDLALAPLAKLDYCASFFVDVPKNKMGIPIAEGFLIAPHAWTFR